MKKYTVHSIFHTIQGEGVHMGKPAVFVRFSGCNLWSGKEADRQDAICKFCDTEFVSGQKYERGELVKKIQGYPEGIVVFTGGEPSLQLDAELVRELQSRGRYVAIETNGTRVIPSMLDWVCVSPKADTEIVVEQADELKLVFPQERLPPWLAAAKVKSKNKWLSPMDGENLQKNIELAVNFVKLDSRWRLNIQAHKIWGIL
jgi:7-carboxy-7-deazaguanine synthase